MLKVVCIRDRLHITREIATVVLRLKLLNSLVVGVCICYLNTLLMIALILWATIRRRLDQNVASSFDRL